MGDFQRALYDYSVAIKMAKEEKEDNSILADYYCMAGVQHYELGQLDEALKHYDMAIEKNSGEGKYFYNRGIVHSRLDKIEKAIDDYTAAILNYKNAEDSSSKNDHMYQAVFNRGICYRRVGPGRLDQSIEDLKKAVELKGNERPSVHNNLGLSYFERGDFEDALNHYTKAISLEKSAVHYNNRGLAYYHMNRL